jgi:hypothetical protein
MDNIIPQTAEVSRSEAKNDVQYDGAPQFSPIPNTSLAYAQNTPSLSPDFVCVVGYHDNSAVVGLWHDRRRVAKVGARWRRGVRRRAASVRYERLV